MLIINNKKVTILSVSTCVTISICVTPTHSRHTVLTLTKIRSDDFFLGVPGQKIVWLRRKPWTEQFPQSKFNGIWCTLQGCRASNLWQKLICSDKVAVLISKIDYAAWSSQTTVAFRSNVGLQNQWGRSARGGPPGRWKQKYTHIHFESKKVSP